MPLLCWRTRKAWGLFRLFSKLTGPPRAKGGAGATHTPIWMRRRPVARAKSERNTEREKERERGEAVFAYVVIRVCLRVCEDEEGVLSASS